MRTQVISTGTFQLLHWIQRDLERFVFFADSIATHCRTLPMTNVATGSSKIQTSVMKYGTVGIFQPRLKQNNFTGIFLFHSLVTAKLDMHYRSKACNTVFQPDLPTKSDFVFMCNSI